MDGRRPDNDNIPAADIGLCTSSAVLGAAASALSALALSVDGSSGSWPLGEGVEIRDQRPLPQAALTNASSTSRQPPWYDMLNERVFFWLAPARVMRQHRACGPRPQVVLTIDTARLVETHREQVSVSPINTGNARRRSHPPVEVTITGAIPAIGRYIVDVTPLHAGDHFSPA